MISAENWAGVSLFTAECSAKLGHQSCDRSECSHKGTALGARGPQLLLLRNPHQPSRGGQLHVVFTK